MKKKQEKRTENIHVRLSKKEKMKLEKGAAKAGISVSEYLRLLILEKKRKVREVGKECEVVVLCQDLITYIMERYSSEDEELRERMERIWKIL